MVRRLAVLVVVGAVAVFVMAAPVSGWWSQRNEISSTGSELSAIESDNAELQRRLDLIEDPAELERIARRDLGLVREGEESYTVLPAPTAGLVLPEAWPFNRVAPALVADPGP